MPRGTSLPQPCLGEPAPLTAALPHMGHAWLAPPCACWVQGISSEVGAFVAGVMLTATDQQEVMLHQLEPVSRFFLALFISSTGLVLSPRFLLHHLPVLAMGVMVVIIAKTCLVSWGEAGCAVGCGGVSWVEGRGWPGGVG